MSVLGKLFSKKSSAATSAGQSEQAVIIMLDGQGLPQEVYDKNDLSTLEDALIAALNGTELGEYDGNEFGPESVKIFLYGPNADKLFRHIEPVLTANPLCSGAQVLIRQGQPGATEYLVQF